MLISERRLLHLHFRFQYVWRTLESSMATATGTHVTRTLDYPWPKVNHKGCPWRRVVCTLRPRAEPARKGSLQRTSRQHLSV